MEHFGRSWEVPQFGTEPEYQRDRSISVTIQVCGLQPNLTECFIPFFPVAGYELIRLQSVEDA